MGEVYRAKDTRLGRNVAIKILPTNVSSDPERKQRFEREARAISSLNHPNICALYDLGTQDGVEYLILEYVEGETLAKRLENGPLQTKALLCIGIEIAEALANAHRKGITHRDLKPSNIMLASTGAKLLDFGLAKWSEGSPSEVETLKTLTGTPEKLTERGTILGTVRYMSPEQLEGKEVDSRTDLFALGEILFEMATGLPAFTGKTKASLIAAVLTAEPTSISKLQPVSPPALDQLVRGCLAKDPDERWQSAHDVKLALQWIAAGGFEEDKPNTAISGKKNLERLAWSLMTLASLMVATLTVHHFRKPASEPQSIRFLIAPPRNTFASGPSISPDGTRVAFVVSGSAGGPTSLWVRRLDSATSEELRGTEQAYAPFWSPDNRLIAFFADGKLKRIESSGGSPATICDAPEGSSGTWSRAGVIVFAQDKILRQVPAVGGPTTSLTALDQSHHEVAHVWPQFLPDGQHFLYLAKNREQDDAIYVGSLNSKERKRIASSHSMAAFAEDPSDKTGYLLFVRDGTLLGQPFDSNTLEVTGEARTVVAKVVDVDINPYARASFSASSNGILVYHAKGDLDNNTKTQLVWFDRSGKRLETVDLPGLKFVPRLSPDGKQLAIERVDAKAGHLTIWLMDLARGIVSPFAADPGADIYAPVWSPDGARIVFASDATGMTGLYQKSASGVGNTEALLKESTDTFIFPTDWSSDGRFIAYTTSSTGSKFDLWILPTGGNQKPFLFLQTQFNEMYAHFSPDGKWIAYASDESGKWEIYVRTFG